MGPSYSMPGVLVTGGEVTVPHTEERACEDRQKMATMAVSFVNLSPGKSLDKGTVYHVDLGACLWDCPDHPG